MNQNTFDRSYLLSAIGLIGLIAVFTLQASPAMLVFAAIALALSISSAIHHAEVIAKKVGSSLGTLILAIAVTVIEVGLIISIMMNPGDYSAVVARDTVFAAVIIVTNGVVGISFLLGGLRHRDLDFQIEGTSSLLAVLATLVGVTLILPNYTTTTPGPTYSNVQLIFVSIASLVLYAGLVIAQTRTNASDYSVDARNSTAEPDTHVPSRAQVIGSSLALFISLVAVVGLAKSLSPSLEQGLVLIGAPKQAVGILIALFVLMPEAGAALSAARSNQLQTSLNLALGSGAASIALTIPVVSVFAIATSRGISLGLGSKETAFVLLTFIVSSLTLVTGKGAVLKGLVHLVIMAAFVILSLIP